jgi:ketosteroid isomerase-like protein
MKRSVIALFVTAVAVILTGCQPAVDTNRNQALAKASPQKEAFDPAEIEAEVLKLEREWADANKSHNSEAVRRLVADDAVIVYPDGTLATKADEVRTIESGAITADAFEMVDPKVTVVNADSAYVTGRSVIRNGKYKDATTKKTIDISGDYRFLDVYARRDGKWQAVASQATSIATPAK